MLFKIIRKNQFNQEYDLAPLGTCFERKDVLPGSVGDGVVLNLSLFLFQSDHLFRVLAKQLPRKSYSSIRGKSEFIVSD